VVHEMPLRPSAIAQVSPELDNVLLIALAKAREARFASAADLVAAFTAATSGTWPDDLARRARSLGRHQPWRELERKN
jgi:hypothetical protein